MRHYRKITFFENKRRYKKLHSFHEDVIQYFESLEGGSRYLTIDEKVETKESRKLRPKINAQIPEIKEIVEAADQASIFLYTEPPARGGRRAAIDLFDNIFQLSSLGIPPQYLTDLVERAAGIYESDFRAARRRTFNPFFWLGLLFDFVASLPFRLLEKMGVVSRSRAEKSLLGKVFKGLFYLVTTLIATAAALLTILDLLGYMEEFRALTNL